MYFEFLHSTKSDCNVVKDPKFDDPKIIFSQGRLIGSDIQGPVKFPVDCTAANPPTDFAGAIIPVMSNRLIKALQDIGVDNLQCFPAVLINEDTGDKWSEYQAVNIIGLIACADFSKSYFGEIGGGLYDFDQLVVDPTKIMGQIFFRLEEDPTTIIAHKKIGDHLYGKTTPEMTGFMFRPAFIP
jgi:hypothetical protein